jgi:hypothetical protein
MPQSKEDSTIRLLKSSAPFILVVAVAFFSFELWLLANSFSADYIIYSRVADTGFTFWSTYWVSSEFVGEIGLIVRFSGACFFLVFSVLLFRRGEFLLKYLRKGIFLEATQYLFFIPFITYLLLRPSSSLASYEAATSYVLQLFIIAPLFLILFLQLRKQPIEASKNFKWAAIGAVGFVAALYRIREPLSLAGSADLGSLEFLQEFPGIV